MIDYNKIPLHDWYYFAGFIDGEGSFGFYTARYRYDWQIAISNTCLSTLRFINETFGGRLVQDRKRKQHHLDSWVVKWTDLQTCIELLLHLIPLLKTKRRQATLLLEALFIKQRSYGKMCSDFDKERLLVISQELKANKRYAKSDQSNATGGGQTGASLLVQL